VHSILLAGQCPNWLTHLQYEPVAEGHILPSDRFAGQLRGDVARHPPQRGTGRARMLPGRTFPLRNPNFVGRADLLVDMESRLYWGTDSAPRSGLVTVAVQALHGTGGVGKTQIAAEYAHRRAGDYDVIAWIDAEQPALIAAQLADLAPDLDVPARPDVATTAEAVIAALAATSLRWLLVFDNATDAAELTGWLPRFGTARVIITSRATGWSHLGATVEVDVLTAGEAVELLRERALGVAELTAGRIVQLLGFSRWRSNRPPAI
jgi:NB-ARC domain